MGEQVGARFLQKGLQLSRLERTPDKREVGGSSPLKPTGFELFKSKRCTLKTAYTIYIENVKTLEIGKDIRGIMCESM